MIFNDILFQDFESLDKSIHEQQEKREKEKRELLERLNQGIMTLICVKCIFHSSLCARASFASCLSD